MRLKSSYTYDDLGIVPDKLSAVSTRDSVDPSTVFLGYGLSLPIVVAPMKMVVNLDSALAIRKLGGIACLPRSDSFSKDMSLYDGACHNAIPSIRVKKGKEAYTWLGEKVPMAVCIDVANGFHTEVGDLIKEIRDIDPDVYIIAGNVGSIDGFIYLATAGADAVRVGIGGGSVCITSISTGIGVGQASLVRDIATCKREMNTECLIIADGGIRRPADMVKAIALGADVVMAGRIFAGSEESPGEVIKHQGKKYKQYAGEASFAVKRSDKYVEGDETLVPYSGPMAATWHRFEDGLRSAMSYMGALTLDKLRFLPDENFVLLSASAGRERYVHA